MTDRHRCELLNQLRLMTDYVDLNYDKVVEAQARDARVKLNEVWKGIERRAKHE